MARKIISNKKAKTTLKACDEIKYKFNSIIKTKMKIFEDVYAEVNPSNLAMYLKIEINVAKSQN